jgi:hypothetical protein
MSLLPPAPPTDGRRRRLRTASLLAVAVSLAAGCGSDTTGSTTAPATSQTTAPAPASDDTALTTVPASGDTAPPDTSETSTADLSAGYAQASWGDNVTVTIDNGVLRYVSDGIPNHERNAEYAIPTGGVIVPDASTAVATADPTVAQSYDYTIPLTPTMADEPTSASLGVIGVMISGASLFNPYEGDGSTVATQSNFSVKGSAGNDVWFLDDCGGHPTPMGRSTRSMGRRTSSASRSTASRSTATVTSTGTNSPLPTSTHATASPVRRQNFPMACTTTYCWMSPTPPRRSVASAVWSTTRRCRRRCQAWVAARVARPRRSDPCRPAGRLQVGQFDDSTIRRYTVVEPSRDRRTFDTEPGNQQSIAHVEPAWQP